MVLSQAGSDTKKPLNLNGSPMIAGAGVSTVFGFISSFFGIGGGFLYVPAVNAVIVRTNSKVAVAI